MPVGALLVGVRDLQKAGFVESFAQELQANGQWPAVVRLGNAHPKEKIMPVRLTVSGVVPRKLIPDKKGVTLF